jgi:hypothetical protein
MRKVLFASLIAVATQVLVITSAHAGGYVVGPGNDCNPADGVTTVDHDDYGTGNQSTTTDVWFFCPLVLGSNTYGYANMSWAHLYYNDQSSTSPFSCYTVLNAAGTMYWGATRFTCSTAGGCADSTTSFTGVNYLTWTYSSNQLPTGIFSTGGNFNIKCDLPPATSGNWSGRSWIIAFDTQN